MSFDTSEKVDKALVTKTFETISHDFNTSTAYYALNGWKLDNAAKTYFQQAMAVFENNANVIRSKDITGRYDFYVQRASDGVKVATKTLTF